MDRLKAEWHRGKNQWTGRQKIQSTRSLQKEKEIGKEKMNTPSGAHGIIIKYIIFMSLESWKEKEGRSEKTLNKTKAKSWANSKPDKSKEIHTKTFLIRKKGGQEEVVQYFSNDEKRNVKLESHSHQKKPSGLRGKSRHYQIKEN